MQAEVEKFYTEQGYLLGAFHQGYWFGLVTNSSSWPAFRWSDNAAPALGECSGPTNSHVAML